MAGTEFCSLIMRILPFLSTAFFLIWPVSTIKMHINAAIRNGKYIKTRSSALDTKTHFPSLSFNGSGHEPEHCPSNRPRGGVHSRHTSVSVKSHYAHPGRQPVHAIVS